MRTPTALLFSGILLTTASFAAATQADDTTVAIIAQNPGASPFIAKITLSVSNLTVLDRIEFSIAPKPNSVTRPLSATYSSAYLDGRGFVNPSAGEVTLPVFGLYDGYNNRVSMTYSFKDGSSKKANVAVQTAAFDDGCQFNTPEVRQARTTTTALSYDFILVGSNCGTHSPTIIDTDGAVRWVGTADVQNKTSQFFDNAIYQAQGPRLLRIEFDGAVSVVADYSTIGVRGFHHNIDPGKAGLLLGVNTEEYAQAVLLDVNAAGEVKKQWNLAEIIRNEMVAGGDDPSEFIRQHSQAWFHNNSAVYRRADDSVVISSRENFVICLDYESSKIKWILGDKRKQWYQYPSLRKYALELTAGGIAPSGQHTVSIGKDGTLLLFDNGVGSLIHVPHGPTRGYAAARKYKLQLKARTATEVWNFANNRTVHSPFCSGVYEDAPENYVITYSPGTNGFARILGLTPTGEKVFEYAYPTNKCEDAYRSAPIHLENISFPEVDVQLTNISARANVGRDDNVGIDGFIITGPVAKKVIVRGLGPSLEVAGQPVAGRLMNPRLELHARDQTLQTNDDYANGPDADAIAAAGLAPADLKEAAMLAELSPGAYTTVLQGEGETTGVGLTEVYDLQPHSPSHLVNLSARALSSAGDNVLIGGLVLAGSNFKRVLFRALGPTLAEQHVADAMANPTLELHDMNGVKVATNDDWQDAANAEEIEATGAAPTDPHESAILAPLNAGAYTFIARGAGETSGVTLVEAYRLD